jgi:glycosyltransferase involved in cell wall biosynthesis
MIERTSPGRPDDRILRVLLLIKGLGRGGAEQLLVNAVEHGDRTSFEYHVGYLLPWKDSFVSDLAEVGVDAVCLRGARGIGWVGRLRRLVRDRRIDIVHVHSPLAAALVRIAFPRRPPVVVYTEHNVWSRYHPATYWLNAVTYARNDHVFTVSEEVEDSVEFPWALRFLRLPPVETLHHGIDVARTAAAPSSTGVREEFGISPAERIVGSVANFKPHKGHEYLLSVAADVLRTRRDVRFVLVGGGPLVPSAQAEARRLGIDDRVLFTGFRDDARRLMRSFDVFVMASIHEGLPLSLLEAMTLGCPPVATRVGGVGAVLDDGINGYIVEPRDTQTQADRIEKLLDDDALRRTIGAAAKERALAFDVRNAVRRIETVYREMTP